MSFAPLLPYCSALCSGLLALSVAVRSRRSIQRWGFVAGMAVLSIKDIFSGLVAGANSPAQVIYWQEWRMIALALIPGTWLFFSLTYTRGDARTFIAKWRWLILGAFLVPTGIVIGFREDLVVRTGPLAGQDGILRLGWAGLLLYVCLLVSSVLVLTNLERTFRASVGTMRWRIKFMLLGVGVLSVVRIYTSSQALLFRAINPSLEQLNSLALLLAALLIVRSLLRTSRFDLDVYPSRSVLQGSLTILLAGVYLLAVGIFAKVVAYVGGDDTFALKAFVALVALVLLAIVLQSDKVRLRLRHFVSRNFQRPVYDYRLVWRMFTEGTASRVEQVDLSRSLVRLIADMFQTLSVTLWLIDERKETLSFAASTSLSESGAEDILPTKSEAAQLLDHFKVNPDPADIEANDQPWAITLRRCQPGEFVSGGHRICVPLIGRGEVLGFITLGDRVGGIDFTLQDFDMLKCVADHAAASLLNAQLSQKLLQSKELEAFQTMATFFVHDLKNAASTLNLMLQNLPVHFDDPAFRADALRGIAKTVSHINNLTGRLSLLRHELKILHAPGNLNEVVDTALTSLGSVNGISFVKNLATLPEQTFDREQILKVVTNLLLNSTEATPAGGHISLTTSHVGEWVVFGITDDGCGMSQEFLGRSLFRPFQTTKKSGLGIGMFQSKMIVEAHGGRITVASELGRGTTFQMFLPLPHSVKE